MNTVVADRRVLGSEQTTWRIRKDTSGKRFRICPKMLRFFAIGNWNPNWIFRFGSRASRAAPDEVLPMAEVLNTTQTWVLLTRAPQ